MHRILIIISLIIIASVQLGIAGEVNVPNTFQAGQKAVASEVNQNFDAFLIILNAGKG